jgi:hypothetical protein
MFLVWFLVGAVSTVALEVWVLLKVIRHLSEKTAKRLAAARVANAQAVKKFEETGEIEESLLLPGGANEAELDDTVDFELDENSPLLSAQDKDIIIEGPVKLQFGGKRKTRQLRYCYLKGNVLYHQDAKSNRSDSSELELNNCLLRIPSAESKVPGNKSLEIVGRTNSFTFNHRTCDYVYLIFKDQRDFARWRDSIKNFCEDITLEQDSIAAAAAAEKDHWLKRLSNVKLLNKEGAGNKEDKWGVAISTAMDVLFEGSVKFQREGDKEIMKRYCILRPGYILHYPTSKIQGEFEQCIPIRGCELFSVLSVGDMKNAIELRHRNHEIVPGSNVIYLICKDSNAREDWKARIRVAIERAEFAVVAHSEVEMDSTSWLNAIAGRFFLSVRDSEEVLDKIEEKLIKKIFGKLAEKGLGSVVVSFSPLLRLLLCRAVSHCVVLCRTVSYCVVLCCAACALALTRRATSKS